MVEILFLAHNRLEFTREALRKLIANTEWQYVSKLIIYDDSSSDGTLEFLLRVALSSDGRVELESATFGGPVAAMNDYIRRGGDSEWFAKIDNDTVVPPGWLGECLKLCEGTDLLGIEAMRPSVVGAPANRVIEPASHIGGIGLMRRSVFERELPEPDGRFGFTAWQERNPDIRKSWINPALPVILLDHVPWEPWVGLSAQYEANGWQRPWPRYTTDAPQMEWWR